MKRQELEAIKRVLADEFGLTGIDDPDQLRLLLQAKLSEMNALDRAAFQMRLGGELRKLKSGEPLVTGGYIFLGTLTLVVIAWFIWRPLAAVSALMDAASYSRYLAIRHSPLWFPQTALRIGGIYGVVLAILVKTAAIFTVHSVLGEIVLGVLGFLAAGYIGHGVPTKAYLRMPEDEMRLDAQVAAIVGYSVAVVLLFVGHLLLTSK